MAKRGRPCKITDEHRGVLLAIVEADPGANGTDLSAAL
jgi:hypothetical protein